MITYYAPAEREPDPKIKKDFNQFDSDHCLKNMINAMPSVAAILNDKRQVVFSNRILLQLLGINNLNDILGKRPGEILDCIHSTKLEGGCGTSPNCSVCGVANAIMESQETNEQALKECRIRSLVDGRETAFDLLVTVTPVDIQSGKFYFFALSDISHEKRRKALEKIFFHDIINTAGGVQGFISLLKSTEDPTETKQYLNILEGLSKDLINEIQEQRELIAAENGELQIKIEALKTINVLNKVSSQVKHNETSCCKNIRILDSDHTYFESDYNLLRRVLLNMLKNALEATPKDREVTISAKEITSNLIEFRVSNPVFIPEKTQMQIFQRSFSTKGVNRGLGTYSMKLLGEQYLSGRVGFTSNEIHGTSFFIRLRKKYETVEEQPG